MATDNSRAIEDDITRRTVARNAYRAKIESLLDESSDERLADVWQRVCPFPLDLAYELPDRRGIIGDLTDLAVVLQPGLDGMKADGLCRLIEKCAACASRQFDLPVVHTTSPDRSGELARERGPLRVEAGDRDEQVVLL